VQSGNTLLSATNGAATTKERSRGTLFLCLMLLATALGYAVFNNGGSRLKDWDASLIILALAGCAYFLRRPPDLEFSQGWMRWLVILAPCYIALQLIPLPVFLVRFLSPTRADLFDSLKPVIETGSFVPLSIAPSKTFTYLLRIAAYTLTFLLIRTIVARLPEQRRWWPVVPLIMIAAIESALRLLHGDSEVELQGTYANKNHFAGLLEMVLPFAVMYAVAIFKNRFKATRTWLKGIAALCFAALILFGLLYSMSKMGFVAGLGGLFVMGALAFGTAKIRLWNKCLAVSGLAALLFFGLVFSAPDQLVQSFGGLLSESGAHGEGRLPIWRDTLHLIRAYPLFGCGLGNYESGFLKYQTAVVDRDFTFAHNDYLELAAELGVVGFGIFAALMVAIGFDAVRAAKHTREGNMRYLGLACVGGIAAIGLHSVTDFNLYIPANAMLLAWICGIAAGLTPGKQVKAPAPQLRKFALATCCCLFVYPPFALAAQAFKHGGGVPAVPKAELLEALRTDPAEPQRWCDLGNAMLKAGDKERALYCFSRALDLGPDIPFMLVQAAKFHFDIKENTHAFQLMTHALALDAGYSDLIFDDYEKRGIQPEEILRYGLPQDARVSRNYLSRLLDEQRTIDAAKTWEWMVSRGYADDKLANKYVDYLMQGGKDEAAVQVWAHYASTRDRSYPEGNRIFNGDFELDPAGSQFDWRIEPAKGTTIDFDRSVRYSGSRSLRIQFDGTQNVSGVGVSQTLFLKPGRYRFQAYVHTEEVSTDEGIAFNVAGFTTKSLLGTNDWTAVERGFQVQPGQELAQVTVVRKVSLRFDSLIRGTVWIDHVSISPD
jgi:O-antigen ligase